MARSLERARYLSDDELRALLAAARNDGRARGRRNLLFLALLATVGMRPGELLNTTRADYTLSDREPMLRVRRLKKRRERGVIDDLPLPRALARLVRRWFETQPVAFADTDRPFPFTVRNAEKLLHRYARAAGLREGVRLYDLRHTAGTRAYRASRDLVLVQHQLGHASPRTTTIYTHVDPEARRDLAERVGSGIFERART